MKYWLVTGTWDEWYKVKDSGIWEIPTRHKQRFEQVRRDDTFLFYVKVDLRPGGMLPSVIVGYAKVNKKIKRTPPEDITISRVAEMLEPYRCEMKSLREFSQPVTLRPLIDSLQFMENKKRWTVYLTSSIREIPKEDSKTIIASGSNL